MIHDPNAPVIVGAAAVQQRFADAASAAEPLALIRSAIEAAADDAGSRRLLDSASVILMPQGLWQASNPARVAAPWNPSIRSIVADLGVLQETLIGRACQMVGRGEAEVVIVAGGEAKFRSLRAQIDGAAILDQEALTAGSIGAPTERLVPAHEVITTEEIQRGLAVPARQYAMIDTALRHAQGLSAREHQRMLAALQAEFASVAASNPDAWTKATAEPLVFDGSTASNPMLAWPYTKLHCSQWNVDQAAALIICSVGAAERLSIGRDRWVYAHVGIESNLMVPMTHRGEIHRSPAVALAGETVLAHCGVAPSDVDHLDLYSCFPAAVRVQTAELSIDPARQLTVTGGMTFAGGPLNNYSLQALAAMVQVLRADDDSSGLVTNISGMLTKYGLSMWSCQPPVRPFEAIDITDVVADATTTVPFDALHVGEVRVITYTVACDRGQPVQGIVVGETTDGVRVLAQTDDQEMMNDMMAADWCGRQIAVDISRILAVQR